MPQLSVSAAGDVNRDGFDDLLIGVDINLGRASNQRLYQRRATYLIYGKAGSRDPINLETLAPTDGFEIVAAPVRTTTTRELIITPGCQVLTRAM